MKSTGDMYIEMLERLEYEGVEDGDREADLAEYLADMADWLDKSE